MSKPIFRMSQSGYCPKRLSAMHLGIATKGAPIWLQSAANEGNWHEARVKDELKALGCEVRSEQAEIRLDFPTFTLLGHVDGELKVAPRLLQDDSKFELHFIDMTKAELDLSVFHHLEVKSMSFLESQRWLLEGFEGFHEHACQQTCYQRAMNHHYTVHVVKDRSGGARRAYFIKGERASMPAIEEKLDTVSQYISHGQLAPADYNPEHIECRRCEFRKDLCGPAKIEVNEIDVAEAITDYIKGRAMEKEGGILADSAKAVLVAFALKRELSRWVTNGKTVYYSNYPRESISVKRLLEILPREAFESAISVSDIDRIRIVDPNKED